LPTANPWQRRRWGGIGFPAGQTKWDLKLDIYISIYRRIKNCSPIMNNHHKIKKIKDYPILFAIISGNTDQRLQPGAR
jgi:hypothetical protein